MSGPSDFLAASSIFFLLAAALQYRKGYFTKYYAQFGLLTILAFHSTYNHVCFTHEDNWCIGSWGQPSASDIAMTRDTMGAINAFLYGTIVLNELVWKFMDYGPMFLACYWNVGLLLGTVLVVHFGESEPLIVSLIMPTVHVAILLGALSYDIKTKPHTFWWFLRFALALGTMVVGVVLKFVATEHWYSASVVVQSDDYNIQEGLAHLFTALAMFFFLSLVPDNEETDHKTVASYNRVSSGASGAKRTAGKVTAGMLHRI